MDLFYQRGEMKPALRGMIHRATAPVPRVGRDAGAFRPGTPGFAPCAIHSGASLGAEYPEPGPVRGRDLRGQPVDRRRSVGGKPGRAFNQRNGVPILARCFTGHGRTALPALSQAHSFMAVPMMNPVPVSADPPMHAGPAALHRQRPPGRVRSTRTYL